MAILSTAASAPALLAASTQYTYDSLKPGPLAGIVVLLLGIALFLLVRNMRKQVRRIDFDESATTDADRLASRRRPPAEPAPQPAKQPAKETGPLAQPKDS